LRKRGLSESSELEIPKRHRRLPQQILGVNEVERLLLLPDTESPYGVRDRALLETLYSTDIRRTELTNLKLYDLDRGRKTTLRPYLPAPSM